MSAPKPNPTAVPVDKLILATKRMAAVIPFFPTHDYFGDPKTDWPYSGFTQVIDALARLCATEAELDWLTITAIDNLETWRGIAALRNFMDGCPLRRRDAHP